MNIDHIKKEFPIFDEKIQNNDLVYLDSANSSQKPKIVVDRIILYQAIFKCWQKRSLPCGCRNQFI